MLFNSAQFIIGFLPITLIGFFLLGRYGWRSAGLAWLVAASAFFYAWFSVKFLGLLALLILFNYAMGIKFAQDFRRQAPDPLLLAFGIGANLSVLGYFKYTNFLIDNANAAFGSHFVLYKIILPIGISFFTFQKIAYLVDAYRGRAEEYNLLEFSLFVMFFPQLIAGPIVHHSEIIPQFRRSSLRLAYTDLAAGLSLFAIGMTKKVMIADTLARWVDPIFSAAKAGASPNLFEAWSAALAFTFQIYFDFSGYTDMALGIALMIGIRLPLNFNSPYKASNIIEFWRHWHMTLSRFLRDYVYIALGGNRRGASRRYLNLMATMLLGGLWHGAAWTFVVWGGLHGLYLILNHGWHRVRSSLGLRDSYGAWGRLVAYTGTFCAVVFAWVFFRAESFGVARSVIKGMVGFNGVTLPGQIQALAGRFAPWLAQHSVTFDSSRTGLWRILVLLALALMIWMAPNSQQILGRLRPALDSIEPACLPARLLRIALRLGLVEADGTLALSPITGIGVAILIVGCLLYQAVSTTVLQPFIYFQF